jgi:hypothetical protein
VRYINIHRETAAIRAAAIRAAAIRAAAIRAAAAVADDRDSSSTGRDGNMCSSSSSGNTTPAAH